MIEANQFALHCRFSLFTLFILFLVLSHPILLHISRFWLVGNSKLTCACGAIFPILLHLCFSLSQSLKLLIAKRTPFKKVVLLSKSSKNNTHTLTHAMIFIFNVTLQNCEWVWIGMGHEKIEIFGCHKIETLHLLFPQSYINLLIITANNFDVEKYVKRNKWNGMKKKIHIAISFSLIQLYFFHFDVSLKFHVCALQIQCHIFCLSLSLHLYAQLQFHFVHSFVSEYFDFFFSNQIYPKWIDKRHIPIVSYRIRIDFMEWRIGDCENVWFQWNRKPFLLSINGTWPMTIIIKKHKNKSQSC